MDKITELISEEEIKAKVKEIADIISEDYKDKTITAVSVLKGAFIFTADLFRTLSANVELNFIRAKSYLGTASTGDVKIDCDSSFDVKGKDILIIEDIIDSGQTLFALKNKFISMGCSSVKMVTFMDKPSRRVVDIYPDYCCFRIEDKFVVGYGLDYNERYRELPYVGVLTPDNE